MERYRLSSLLRIILAAFLVAGLGMIAGCGGGGGGSTPPPVPPKSGDVVWSRTNDPSAIDDWAFGMAISGTNMFVVGFDSNTTLGDDQWHIEKRTLSDGVAGRFLRHTHDPGRHCQ